MSKTYLEASNSATKMALEEKLFRETVKESYFSKMMGSGEDSIVQVKTNLEKAQGDKITFHIMKKLSGTGITGSSGMALEGNEEALRWSSMDLYLEEYAHGVRDRGPLDRQRAFFSIDTESRNALKNWGTEHIDKLCFDALTATTPSKIFYGGTASAVSGLTTGDKLTTTLISKLKTYAYTGGNRAINPIRPVKINGRPHFVLLVHPEVMYDLKQDSTFSQAIREAEVRGSENPLFNGATAMWDGVVIHEHENIPYANDGGSGAVPYAKCFLLGAQSLLFAWGKRPDITAEEFDYKRQHGYGMSLIAKAQKAVFDSKDFGMLGCYVARTNVAA